MVLFGVLLLLASAVLLIFYVLLLVSAFKVHVGWGLGSLLLPPVALVFGIVHWREGGKHVLGVVGGLVAMVGITTLGIVTNPEMKKEFQRAYAKEMRRRQPGGAAAMLPASEEPNDPHKPREARDLAANEAPAAPAVSADPRAAQRAALAQHSAELNTLYAGLNKERATLKRGASGVAAFNAKAAKYQESREALSVEMERLDALDHPAPPAASPAGKSGTTAVHGSQTAAAPIPGKR